MLFSSIHFVVFIMAVFLIYYFAAFRKRQIYILLISSLVFYSFASPYLLLLLIVSFTTNALLSHLVVMDRIQHQKPFIAAGVIFNISILAFFKYNRLFYETIFGSFQSGDSIGQIILSIPLPLGISFYTFQGISLLCDSSRIKRNPIVHNYFPKSFKSHFFKSMLLVSFFPKLLQGPLLKSESFFPQIGDKLFKDIQWDLVFKYCTLGYFLKCVIADNLQQQTFWMAYPYFQAKSSLTLIVMIFGYSVQIFSDFAGYSFIAMGIGQLFGYSLPLNFNYPYISKTFSEFWKRWHISLSNWLKEYLYFPLGGNRKGRYRTYLNLVATMLLGGFWHGAAWSFAIWGLLHGLLLAFERVLKINNRNCHETLIIDLSKRLIVFVSISCLWIFFKLPDFSEAILYFRSIINNIYLPNHYSLIIAIFLLSSPVIIYHALYYLRSNFDLSWICKRHYFLYALMIFFIALNKGPSNEFIYFQF
ncbi:MAG: hypothetical protein KJP07_07125 [Desulfatitalea sp.]|nr:hypothetical protein [Desulfatitalea sp.]